MAYHIASKQNYNYKKIRENLRQWLVNSTGCAIQERTKPGTGWPCGTCTLHLLTMLGLDPSHLAYQEHNKGKDRDRHNEVWRAILQIREAKI